MNARVLTGMIILVCIIGGGYLFHQYQEGLKPSIVQETAEERKGAIAEAYTSEGEGADGDADLKNAAEEFFKEFNEALKNKDEKNLARLFNTSITLDYLERRGAIEFENKKKREGFYSGFKRGAISMFAAMGEVMSWDELEIVKVQKIKENEFIAYTKDWTLELEAYTRIRWWFFKEPASGDWVIYDFEEIDNSIRVTTVIAAMMAQGSSKTLPWMTELKELVQIYQLGQTDAIMTKLLESGDLLDRLLAKKPPRDFEMLGRVLKVACFSYEGEAEKMLEELKILERLDPEMPFLFYMRGFAQSELGQYEEALVNYREYTKFLGMDPEMAGLMAECHLGMENEKEGLELTSRWVVKNPNCYYCLALHAIFLPEERLEEVTGLLDRTASKERALQVALYAAESWSRPDLGQWLYARYAEVCTDDEELEYFREKFGPKKEEVEVE